ncbi:Type I secretion outer membrane protein, TolC precursor [hydrothermal vent metagenome]|uniref:Type I secretion outer membrane protein, TolC n=1 Tax=hydrothermal vent metagenome TaxID=652676 RepID=A0A3B0YP22_9ZZZZ
MHKTLITCLLFFSGTTSAENLKTVLDSALRNDPVLSAARSNFRAIAQNSPQARALLLPNIILNINSSNTTQTGTIAFKNETDNISLSITQPLFNYALFMKLKQAKVTVRKAGVNLNVAYQSLLLRVTERYFAVLTAEDKLAFARAEKRAITRQLEQARKRFDVGLIAITNVHEAQAAFDLATAEVISARNSLASQQEALREITNRQHLGLHRLKSQVPLLSPKPANLEKWTQAALRQNLKLKAIALDATLARVEIKVQKSGHFPTLDIVANKTKNEGTGGFFGALNTDNESIELRLKIPLYTGGLARSKTKQARHQYRQAQYNLERQRRETLRQTREAYRGVIAGISRVRALKQAIVSSQSAIKATKAGYRVGTRTVVDVLNSQRELFKARSNYSEARHNYVLNLLKLKQAAGTLSIKDILSINGWLVTASISGN